jgi:hypothetical protein
MRSALITACMLLIGTYAPTAGMRPQFQDASAQTQAAPPRQAQTERDRQVDTSRLDVRGGNVSVAPESTAARRRAESHRRSSGSATDAQPAQPGNRQLPGAVGLLLSLAVLNGAGAAPPAISQPEVK